VAIVARSPLLAASLLSALVLAGVAGGASVDRTVRSPGGVTALATSLQRVAFASAPAAGDCDRVRLWYLGSRAVTRFGRPRPCGDPLSTGRGIAGLALAGSRALWLAYAGGNIREWTLLTATPSAPTPRQLRFVARDVDEPPPIVLGDGSIALLAYAVDEVVTGLRQNGARAFTWRAPARVAALATGDGKVAALLETGSVVVLSEAGARLAEYAYAPGVVKAVRLGAVGTLVQLTSGTIEIRKGESTKRVVLPPTATMLDYAQGVVLYALGGQARGLRLATGADVLLRTTGTPVRASLDTSGLAYVKGRDVGYVAWWRIAALLGPS
jgi:hypothetical protein